MKRLAVGAVLCWAAALAFFAFPVSASPPAQTAPKLRVGIYVAEPFVISNGARFSGYSIDYWEKLAGALGVAYEYVPVGSQDDVVNGLQNGSLDLVIGPIGMTADREKTFDLTHSYFPSGLQILTVPPEHQSFLGSFGALIGPAVGQVFLVALIFALIMAHVIYFVEHFGKNPDFQQGYLRDIWEAFWYLLIIVATGEYGDKEARTPIKRVVTVAFWLLGVLFIAQFTAAATSTLTVQKLTGGINGPNDLPGKRVVTLAASVAADYLTMHQIPFTTVTRIEDAYAQLEADQADAFVFQAPILEYYAANAGKGKVEVVGPVFAPLPIGIALPLGSSLRKPLNMAILQFYQDGTYADLYAKWFGASSQ